MRFYQDASLTTESCEFKLAPIRFWLVTLSRSETGVQVYAVVLPDGTVVEPRKVEGV
jgi:hypothetical protein